MGVIYVKGDGCHLLIVFALQDKQSGIAVCGNVKVLSCCNRR